MIIDGALYLVGNLAFFLLLFFMVGRGRCCFKFSLVQLLA